MKKKLNTCGKLYGLSMLSALSCIVFLLSIAGCTRTVYVPLESRTASTSDREHIAVRVDTVVDRDTVTLTLTAAGDTARKEVTRWRTRIKEKTCTLTVWQTDTIFREIPVGPQDTGSASVPWYYRPLLPVVIIITLALAIKFIISRIFRTKHPL